MYFRKYLSVLCFFNRKYYKSQCILLLLVHWAFCDLLPEFLITISVIVRKMKTYRGFVSVWWFVLCVVILYPAAFTFYIYFTETISENRSEVFKREKSQLLDLRWHPIKTALFANVGILPWNIHTAEAQSVSSLISQSKNSFTAHPLVALRQGIFQRRRSSLHQNPNGFF